MTEFLNIGSNLGGRPKTGTVVKTRDGRWQGVITLADGKRKRLAPFDKGTSREMAKEKVAYCCERNEFTGLTPKQMSAAISHKVKVRANVMKMNNRQLTNHILCATNERIERLEVLVFQLQSAIDSLLDAQQ